jgi:hypothetical protein
VQVALQASPLLVTLGHDPSAGRPEGGQLGQRLRVEMFVLQP